MKKILFFVPLVLAVLAGCEKEVVEDDPIRMDPDHLTYVEEGVRLIAGAEQSRVTFNLDGDGTTYTASHMAWEKGDIIKVWYNGKIRRFVTNTAGAQGNFNPMTKDDIITREEFDGSKKLIAYYNVTSIAEETGNASFTIAANQTEGDATNKIPLYAYLENAALVYDEVHIQFKPMASVVDFSVSAAARLKDGEGEQVLSYDHEGFSYKLKKVVLEPNDVAGASGWTVGTCTFDPSTGEVTPADDNDRSAITFNFADTTEIAIEGGRHFQMVVGQCRLNESGAEMRWYKKGDDPNYVKSLWASRDIDLTSGHKYLFQGINPKAVGLYDYDDYVNKFYNVRATQDANYINICDDERNVILTGDIDMGDGVKYFNRTLSWGFDGRNHCFYNFNVTDATIPGFIENVGAGIKNLRLGDGINPAVFNISDASGATLYGPLINCGGGTVSNVTSNVNYTLNVTHASYSRFMGGIVGRLQNCDMIGCNFNGSLLMTTDASAHSNTLHMGGIAGRLSASLLSDQTRVARCYTSSSATIEMTVETEGHVYCAGISPVIQNCVTISGCCNAAAVFCSNAPANPPETGKTFKMVVAGVVSNVSNDAYSIIRNTINLGAITSTGTVNVTTSEVGGISSELNRSNTLENCGNGGDLSATGAATNNIANWYANWPSSGIVVSGKVLLGCTINGVAITTSNYADRYLWAQTSVMGTLSYVTTVADLEAILNE